MRNLPVLGSDRFFDDFWRPFFSMTSEARKEYWPEWRTKETDSHYLFSVDLPGVKKDDVKVEIQENRLTVKGERKDHESYGRFERSFTLPEIDTEKTEASFENGVLRLALPKAAEAKPREISVKEGAGKYFDLFKER